MLESEIDTPLARAARCVSLQRDAILSDFIEASRTRIAGAQPLGESTLADHLPDLLALLSRRLSAGSLNGRAGAEALDGFATHHARQRFLGTDYGLRQIIEEHALLRSLVARRLRAAGCYDEQVEATLDAVFTRALAGSIEAFRAEDDAARVSVDDERRGQEGLLRTILESLPAGFMLVEAPSGRPLLSNKLAEYILGHPLPDVGVEGYAAFHAMHPDGRSYDAHEYPTARALRGATILREPMLYRTGSGTIAHLEISSAPVFDQAGDFFAVANVISDETRKVGLVAALEAEQVKLETEKGVRERFVATLSHDLRTPLVVIRMATEALGYEPALPRAALPLLEKIKSNVGRADRMIRDLLDADALARGNGVALDSTRLDLATLARDVVADLTVVHGPRFRLTADGDARGDWDEDALRRVIENLCGNAVKYGAPGAPVTVSVDRRDRTARLSVHNQGEPIDPDERERLFKPFERSRSARGTRPGWGIGLTLVRGFAEAHGGKVDVESEAGKGTTFRVTLPC